MLILRRYGEDRTESKMIYPDSSYTFALERPWLNNKPFVSCVPEGKYLVDRDHTGKHRWYKIREGQIKGRSFIEFHPASTVDQLEGCIAPCMDIINGRCVSSTEACKKLIEWYGENSFWVEIRKWHPRKDGTWKE